MVNSCSAYGCTNRFNKNRPDISFFGFPFTRPEILWKWFTAIRRKNWFPTKTSCLCSKHFLPGDFFPRLPGNMCKRLKPDAVPSQFDFSPPVPQKKKRKKLKEKLVKRKKKPCSKSKEIKNKAIKTQSTKELNEEPSKTKANIFCLSVLTNNSSSVDADEVNRTLDDRTIYYEENHQQISEESDTETSSETEEEISNFSEITDYSPDVTNNYKIPNSEEILQRRLDIMTARYEKTLEKMTTYQQKWKMCLKQVTSLENIIDNLKAINSVADDS